MCDYAPHKLSPISPQCVFLGYSTLHKGFRCLDPKKCLIYISRHMHFHETCFPYAGTNGQSLPNSYSYTQLCKSLDCGSHLSACFLDPLPFSSTSDLTCLSCNDTIFEFSPSNQMRLDASTPDPVPIDYPPSPLSFLPLSVAVQTPTDHPMLTRGKTGIFKPKAYHALILVPSSQFF